MSWLVRYHNLSGAAAGLSIESACYMLGDRERLEREFDDKSKAFSIIDADSQVVAEGRIHGSEGDLDWPLVQARILKRVGLDARRVQYEDGTAFVWSKKWNDIVPEDVG